MPVPPKPPKPPLPACARCGDPESADYEVCRHVAENRAIEVYAETGAVLYSSGVRLTEEHCGDRECPRKPLCGPCWDNLYDGIAVESWWPAEASEANNA